MSQQQYTAGASSGGDNEDVGWHDTDSEGFVNDWQVQNMDSDDEQEPVAAAEQQPQPGTAVPTVERTAAFTMQDHHQQQQHQLLPQQEEPQLAGIHTGNHHHQHEQHTQPAAAATAAGEEPHALHRRVAALIHQRVQALLRQRLQAAHVRDDAAAAAAAEEDTVDLQALLQHAAAGGSSSMSGSGSNDSSSSSEEMEDADDPEGCTRFDPNVTAAHQYLGDVDELEGAYGHLAEGTTARLPLLLLDGVVLFPGCQLPLLLATSQEQRLLERALAAPPPLTRLLAVLPGSRTALLAPNRLVCCTAEIRQMRRQEEEGAVAVLALGRQRAKVVVEQQQVARSQSSVLVRILPEGCQMDVPLAIRCHASAIHPALAKPWDLSLLVARVRQLIQLVLMPVASFQGTPLELSYWVSHNLPLQPSTRQLLLSASCPAERLRMLLGLLERLDQLGCSSCGAILATTADVLAMTSEGIAGTFVNSHGYVHEMVTFKRVQGIHLEGRPETAHSWFPGYAWTIAYCHTCRQHLGWRFTATQQGLTPRLFWGLRRPVLTCSTRPAATAASAAGDGADGAGGGVHGGGQGQQQLQQQEQHGAGGFGGTLVIQLGQLPVRIAAEEHEDGDAAADENDDFDDDFDNVDDDDD